MALFNRICNNWKSNIDKSISIIMMVITYVIYKLFFPVLRKLTKKHHMHIQIIEVLIC